MVQQQEQPGNELFTDISIKLRDIEEKQNLIKDRVLLIGENLVSEKEDTEKEFLELRARIANQEEEIRKIKLNIQMLIDNLNNFTRKNEFDILKRQFEMFSPLELARITDVAAMIDKRLKQK